MPVKTRGAYRSRARKGFFALESKKSASGPKKKRSVPVSGNLQNNANQENYENEMLVLTHELLSMPKMFLYEPLYMPFECFTNAFINRLRYYKDLDLTYVVGSLYVRYKGPD